MKLEFRAKHRPGECRLNSLKAPARRGAGGTSGRGTSRTSRHVRLESVVHTKTDVQQRLQICTFTPLKQTLQKTMADYYWRVPGTTG